MKLFSTTAIIAIGSFIFFAAVFAEKTGAAQQNSSQQKAVSQQHTPESPTAQKQEATTATVLVQRK